MNGQLDDHLRMRLSATLDRTDDSDWLEVHQRAQQLATDVAVRQVTSTGSRIARPRRGTRRHERFAPWSWARSGRLIAACVAIIAVITAAVEVLPLRDNSRPVLGLDAVAAIAAAAPSTVPGPGEYAYTTRRFGIAGRSLDCTQEWWIAQDGSGRVQQHGELCAPVERRSGGNGLDARFGPGEATRVYVELFAPGFTASPEDLPTDPHRLESALDRVLRGLADTEPGELEDPIARSDGMLAMIEQALANPLASPTLRSALYRVAARLPGVKLNHDVTDPAGRRGSAITLNRLDRRVAGKRDITELIFDPTTSRSLATRLTDTVEDTQYRSTTYHVYLEQATVDSLNARP